MKSVHSIFSFGLSLSVLGLMGCLGSAHTTGTPTPVPEAPGRMDVELSYNLTTEGGRAAWKPEGLSFVGVAGPYAVYRVTGAQQRLVGPAAAAAGSQGVVAVGTRYFSASAAAKASRLFLMSAEGKVLFSTEQQVAADGACVGSSVDGTPPSSGNPPAPETTDDAYGSGCVTKTDPGPATPPSAGPWGSSFSGTYSNPGDLTGGGWTNNPCMPTSGSGGGSPPSMPSEPSMPSQPVPTDPPAVPSGVVSVAFNPPLATGDVVLMGEIVIGGDQTSIGNSVGVCCQGSDCKAAETGDIIL